MIARELKRCLSFLLALVMIFSVVPVQAFATEDDGHDHEEAIVSETTATDPVVTEPEATEPEVTEPAVTEPEATEPEATEPKATEPEATEPKATEPKVTEPAAEPSALAKELVTRINAVLQTYGVTAEMTDLQIKQAIAAQPWSVQKPTITEISQIEAMAEDVTEAEEEYVLTNADAETFVRFAEIFKAKNALIKAAAGTHKPVTGVTVGVSGATDNSMSNGAVTVTAKGSGGILGFGASAKTATITVYNESGSKANISFDWAATSVNQLKIDDSVYSGTSGSFSKVLDAGENFVVTITTAKNSTTNKLVMNNFACVAAKESSVVTFQYDSDLGSVTAAGETVAADAQLDVPSSGVELVASTKNGATFLGWINAESHEILSKAASFVLEPADDMSVQAVFAKDAAWFLVNGNCLYEGLNAAVEAVASVANKTIILANSGTLPSGNYTIPSGVTLLIPYNDANTLCTTAPTTADTVYKDNLPKVYRKLTMEAGANIVIDGALSLSAMQSSSGGASAPIGNCSFVQMDSGSTITVNKGGNLYAWGYIQGSGSVTVKSGGTAYECFQLMDWRGGDNTSSMIGNGKRVFPMSQYYVQNIEVPMTLEAGATENGYMSVTITLVGIQGCAVPFIGANGMFNITSGSIVKDYDENTGRLLIDMYGTLSVKSLSLSMKLGLIGSKTINSKDYVLPINGNMTVTMHSGSSVTMTQDIALQPGARMIIEEGATCTLGSGNKIYVYDYDQWILDSGDAYDEGKSFCGNGDATSVNLKYPTSAQTVQGRTEDAYVEVNGTVDASAGFVYTTTGGANVCGTGTIIMKPGTETVTHQAKSLGSDSKTITYYDIPITSAKLQNADGTYVETAGNTGKVIYKSVSGNWICAHTYADGTFREEVTTAATCEADGLKTFFCHCGGNSYTEVIPALGHNYEAVVTAPTCTADGYTTHICKNDPSHTYTDTPEAALGHDEVSHEAKAPTCTEIGWDAYVTCSRCDYTTYVEIAALGHTETQHAAQAPTCTQIGWNAYVTCSVCGYSTYEEITAVGHSYDAVVTAPTCTEAGYTTHTCSNCGDSYTDTEVAAAGHKWEWITDKDATVLNPGVKHEECSVCHIKQNENTEIPVLACSHEGTLTGTEAKAETCLEAGNTAYWYCSACQNYYSDATGQHEIEKDSWILDAKGHNHVAAVTYPAGEAKGYVDYTCSHCGDTYRTLWLDATAYNGMTIACVGDSITAAHGVTKDENDYVKLLAEKLGMEYIRLGVSGTTLATGGSRTCNIEQLTEAKLNGADVVTIAMGINDFVAAQDGEYELGDINSTDTSTIYGAVKMWCERIAELRETDSLRDTQFYFVTPVMTSWKNASVRDWDQSKTNDNGYTLRDLCNAIIEVAALYDVAVIDLNLVSGLYYVDADDNNIDVFGGDGVHPGAEGHAMMADAIAKVMLQSDLKNDHAHVMGSWITTTWPSCLNGKQQQRVCSVCGAIEVGSKGEALGHDEVQHEAVAPNCTNVGWEAYVTCSRCDYTTRGEDLPINPENHVWDEGKPYMNHSCNSASYMKYTCTLCKETELVVVREQHFRIPIAEEIPATCTEDGMTSGWKCEKCDEFWIPQEVIPALGHDWNGSFPCQSETSACKRCDLHFDSKQDCKRVEVAGYPATCTEPGLTDGAYCEYCGEVIVAQTEIPVAEHTWIKAEQEVPATCNSVGHHAGARYCMDCDYDENAIPMLEHEWMHRDAKKATYSAIGWNAHDYCLLCNTIKTLEQFENDPCEFCGENPEGYIEIPKVEVQRNATVEEFLTNLGYLEMMAEQYAKAHPGTDPLALVLNYLRTGVANYTTGSWAIMAGPEDKDFLKYVQEAEDAINSDPEVEVWVNVSGLKKIKGYSNTHKEINIYSNSKVTILDGHLFGTMDMTYHNKGSQNHADVGGWVGDLTDLLSTTDEYGVPANLTLDEKVEYIREKYLFKVNVAGSAGSFGYNDLYSDLDGYYFMNELITKGYKPGDLAKLMGAYYQPGLTLEQRVSYLLTNRLDGLSTRQDLRTAVYNAYTSNKLIATLEGTRNFVSSGNELAELRKAVCYAFADEMCRVAGDYVEDLTNPRFTVFDTETKILAPGVSQQINYATNADGKQIVYYVATADVNRKDVGLWVNYYDRDPGTPENPQWKNNSVPSSAQNAQDRYGDPESPDYIENFNVIASTNAGGYDMSDVATPGGLVVMNGIEWFPQTNTAGFFAILNDGTAYMGTHDEYQSMMAEGKIQEAIGGFGEFVVQDGKVVGNATYSDAPRTSVGITSTGRVVIMCIDGRQAPFSSGASLQDVGYIMKEAGCVVAINLDGGGSTTFVARQPGSDELTIMNRPSDGYPRNVSTNLLIYSTAPSSTKFDHAVVESEYDYATIGTAVQMTAAGVSPAGNAVDVPEGATWAVSDEAWGEITEDGVFTGKRLGEVYVYLMLDGQVIGSKLMTMTTPDQLYFEKAKVDAIYGSSVKLPLKARFEGKPIAINPNDVTITLSVPTAGTMDGFTFVAAESTAKTLSVTAALNENAKASINVMLYQQGENNFDFDKATGGDRMLAWHREVTNSKVEDGNIYNVIDPSKDMVTSYTFAMDMTTIPIPERLDELTYMLPGGTVEGTNAWTFLLSLAQRISDLSWVKATIDFDDRFVVDYSEMNIINEYFQMKDLEFDETTNTLTVTMGWIKQSQVIDEATANPLCLIKGLKLTPKAGVWDDVTKIDAVTSGNIGYEIYMRASGLYSFAQKPESQAVFGIYPYRNPADTADAGGYFRDTYAEITDTFTLVNVLKEGWVNEDGGFAYYVDGERLTGIQEVEGFYYDFGEKGVNVGQTKYTGLFFDKQAQVYRYSYIGVVTSGWQMINNEWYYFKPSTMAAVSGHVKVGGVYYDFEETGRLVSGVWVNAFEGMRYYYGPDYYYSKWKEIDGKMYYFRKGYPVTGLSLVASQETTAIYKWYDFGEDGACRGVVSGIIEQDGTYYYVEDGIGQEKYLVCVDGDYYFSVYKGQLVVNKTFYAYATNCDLPKGTYTFGPDGKMVGANVENGIVEKDGKLYYYENGKGVEKYLIKYGDDYYFTIYNGEVVTNKTMYAYTTNCDLPKGTYTFGPDGKMLGSSAEGSIVEIDGMPYYYEKGIGVEKGLVKVDGNYYFAAYKGQLVRGKVYGTYKTSCDLPNGNYEFGADGRMLNGIVEKDGILYYYENGKGVEKGLINVDGNYYFAAYKGQLVCGKSYGAYKTNCDLPKGNYEFGADGKMLQGIVEKDGILYYYENGNGVEKGLINVDGNYYFAAYKGQIAVSKVMNTWLTSCDLPNGNYEFGADGRMLNGIVEKDGILYYYENGKGVEKGLINVDGNYYFAAYKGQLVCNKVFSAYLTNCDLPKGSYEFGADCKMVQGIVEKSDGLYYYENGQNIERGLFELNGDYYFAAYKGKLVCDKAYKAYKTSCDLPIGNYEFGSDGKMLQGIIEKDGKLYYYENGNGVEKKLFYYEGHYYFAVYKGELVRNKDFHVYEGNGLLLEKVYTFNELGQIVK